MSAGEIEVMNKPINLEAYREWQSWPEKRWQFFLNNALCSECSRAGKNSLTSFADGYTIRKDFYGLIVEGNCSRCGKRNARCCE